MADSDKLWFDWGIRGDVLQQLEKATAQATELQRALIAASEDMSFKEGFQNAARMEEVFDSLESTLKRIGNLKPNLANKDELKSLEELEEKVQKTYGHFKTVREQLEKDPSKWTEKDLVKVLELSEGFKLLNTSVSRYLSNAERAAAANSRFFDSISNKAMADLDRFNEQWEKMNSASPYSERDRIVREAKEYQSVLDDKEAQKIADEINEMIEAKKFFEEESKRTIAELEAFNQQWQKMNSTASPFEKIVREAKQYEEELELKAVKEVNEELEKKEKLRKAADDIQEQQGRKILDNLSQQKQIERSMLDTESQRKIASLRNQNVEYSALTKKLHDIKALMQEVKDEEKDLASGKISSPTLTRDVVSSRLETIQRNYNELLAQGKERERQDAEAKEKKAASTRKAAEAVQMLSHVNQGLISSYNRVAEAGNKAHGITIQFQQQLANYTGLYGLERILKSVITIGGQFEVQHVALQNILGDMQEANVLFGQLQELAIESPKTFMELTAYAKQLSAYQIPASELYDTTKRLADMSSGLGVDMNRLILAYGQVRSAAVLRGQELRQFTEAGIPMVQALANKFTELNGKLTTTADVFALISKRAVPFEMVKEVLWDMTNQGGQFYNMQAELADTLYGKWQKLQDQWQITLGNIASGASPAGAALKMLLELTVSLASAFDTLMPMLAMMGAARLGGSIFNSARNKLNEKNGNMAILRMEKAMEQEIARLERERVLYGRQLNAEEQALVNSKGRLRSQEYYLLAVEKQISTLKAYQLMQEGKLEKSHFYKLLQMQGYTREQRKQIANGNILALQNQQGLFSKGWQGFKGFMGGWTGIILTGIGAAMSAYSYFEQKQEELAQKGDAMMSHAQQGANSLSKTLNAVDSESSLEKRIEALEDSLINMGRTGEAVVAKSREHMNDIKKRWEVLKAGAEDYQKTLDLMGNQESKGLFEASLDDSGIEKRLKSYDDAINEKVKVQKLLQRYDEIYKKAIASITDGNEKLKEALSGKNLFEQIEIVGQKKLYDEIFVNRNNKYGAISASAISALNNYFNKIVDIEKKWSDITTKSIPEMEDALKAMARKRNIENFDSLTPEQKRSLETLTREYVNSIAEGSVEAKNKLAQELASQVFHITIVGDLTVDKTKLGGFASYVWQKFGAGGALGDKGNIKVGNSVFSKAQVANVFDDIDKYDKETSDEIDKLRKTLKLQKQLGDAANLVKDTETKIKDKLAERRAVGLDDPKEKGSKGGTKKDAELDSWKSRISLLEKYRKELEELEKLMSRSEAEKRLRKEGDFGALWGYFTNPNDYNGSIDEAIKALGTNGDRKKYVDELNAKQSAENMRVFKDNVKSAVDELQRMMSVMSENYQTYKKWMDLTGDPELAAKVAGVTQNTSYADYLNDMMKRELGKTNLALTPSDIFGLKESDAKKFGENSLIFKIWDEWQKNQQKIRKEQWDLYEEAFKGAKSYDDKIADINRKLEKQINLIKQNKDLSPEKQNQMIGNLEKNASEEIAKQNWEKFKDENNWGEIFTDMDRLTTKAIDDMIAKMEALLPSIKENETAVKDLYNALDKMRKEKLERNPFAGAYESIQGAARLRQLINSQVFSKTGGGTFTPNEQSAKYYGLRVGQTYSKDQLQGLLRELEGNIPKSLSELGNKFKALQDVLSPVLNLFEALGDKDASRVFQIGNNAIGAAAQTAGALNDLGLGNLGPYGAAAAAALSVVSSIVAMHDETLQEEIEASQARQKEMENLTKNLETVLTRTLGGVYNVRAGESTIKSLMDEIGNPFYGMEGFLGKLLGGNSKYKSYISDDTVKAVENAQKTKTYYDAAYASLLAQRDELQHQMASEEDKKDSDSDKLADYRQQLVEMKDQIDNFALDMAKSLWDIDVKSWAKELTDTIVDAWKNGENAVDAYRKKVKEMMLDLTTNILSQKIMEDMLEKVGLDKLISNLMQNTKGELDVDAVAQIADALNMAGEESALAITSILDAMEKRGYISKGEESGSSSASATMKSFSEQTADLIASYINAIRADVSVDRVTIAQILVAVQSQSDMPLIARAQLAELDKIATNTKNNAEYTVMIYDLLHRLAPDGTSIKVK